MCIPDSFCLSACECIMDYDDTESLANHEIIICNMLDVFTKKSIA